ncbi:MAG: ATP-dependent helicase [Chthoniobacteraceae bacterium]|nr:ATP-dependent helicase [Chthoniobacteraceae bacterium]
MSLEIAISPSGRLYLEPANQAAPVLDPKWAGLMGAAFASSSAAGLLLLACEAFAVPLPASPEYWRDFGRLYLQTLCQSAAGGGEQKNTAAPMVPAPPFEELAGLAMEAPPMRGGEFLRAELLGRLWEELGRLIVQETEGIGLDQWLKKRSPHFHSVGRVTFHLAENKRDPERPFAFLATYTDQITSQGQPKPLPLGRALVTYAGAQNQAMLTSLLAPIQRAAEKSPLVRELLESRQIFNAMAWRPQEAHRFLRGIPAFEESGLLVRVPDWWKSGRPPRPQVKVRIGEKRKSSLGLDAIMDFSVGVALDGEELSEKEWDQIMAAQGNLVLLKGKWVEIDRDRLKQVLAQWKRIEKQGGEVSFLEGMRMLSGFGTGTADDALGDREAREWSDVVAGDWLRDTLAAMRDPAVIKGFDPGRDLKAELRGYQQAGVHWLWFMTRLGLGACLADDMGLGKTIQTIALLLQLKREAAGNAVPPSLLVAPASLLANWKNELTRFAPTLSIFFVHPSETSAQGLTAAAANPARAFAGLDLVVTTYGVLGRFEWMRQQPWRIAVIDEAQAIKNPGARQTRAVKELRAQARVALTGTPVENRLGDLWSLFDFICPGLLGTAPQFSRTIKLLTDDHGRHFAPLRTLTAPYLLRRLKTDRSIIADLPDKTELTAWCSLTKAQAAHYEQALSELSERLETSEGVQRRGVILAFLVRFKQICNHPAHWLGTGDFDPAASGKFARLKELAEEIGARQEKMLVFTQFKEMTEPLSAYLEGIHGRPGLILHGGTPVKERQKLVARFQQDDGPPFFILSLKAGGTGLNLTAASHVVHFDRWWNPAVENQATDRAFRIGQKRNVLVHKFVCRGTIEERINEMIEEKKALASDALEGGGEQKLTELPDDELLRFVALDIKSAVQE